MSKAVFNLKPRTPAVYTIKPKNSPSLYSIKKIIIESDNNNTTPKIRGVNNIESFLIDLKLNVEDKNFINIIDNVLDNIMYYPKFKKNKYLQSENVYKEFY